MKISVIIPAYNEEKYLGHALKAVLAQDYPDFEVIVVDNASTDSTAEIARSFSKAKLVSESNRGTMWACEKGRQEATGEIIVRMDADCIPGKDWLSKGSAYFIDQNVVGVTGPYAYFECSPSFRKISLFCERYIWNFTNFTAQLFKRGAILIGGNSFMRSSALATVNGFDTRFTFWGDDTDTAKRLSKLGRIVFDPNLIINTSARRMKNEGVVSLTMRYTFHFFKVLFSK